LYFDGPDFVKQLQFVEIPNDQQLTAISDFLRTSADVVSWAASGLVFEKSFADWETDLIRHYSSIKSEADDLLSNNSEVVIGRTVYNRCARLQPSLEGKEVPGHFVHGSLNALAERRLLGWHPRYVQMFDEGEE
jgi:hypothetical protein